MALIRQWNAVHRLVGSDDPAWIAEHLLLDSLLYLGLLPPGAVDVIDVGSGAGIPGVPLKIARSELGMTLAEARRRRASFLSTVVRELRLGDTVVIADRIEDAAPELEGRFDAVVARCAGHVEELVRLGRPMLRPGGVVVVSGPPQPAEVPSVEWVRVPTWKPGGTRLFAVSRRE